ncbi:MAG TPA: hypothetical protein VFB45_12900 [Pseudolabrys sp.]|nr:hypothetical protein [Pseudolabrys sp.]
MRFALHAVAALLLAGLMAAPSFAGDFSPWRARHHGVTVDDLPYARSVAAEAVWESDVCWKTCGASCKAGMDSCLHVDTQGACLHTADACDRSCQRQCRTLGGPFLPIE